MRHAQTMRELDPTPMIDQPWGGRGADPLPGWDAERRRFHWEWLDEQILARGITAGELRQAAGLSEATWAQIRHERRPVADLTRVKVYRALRSLPRNY